MEQRKQPTQFHFHRDTQAEITASTSFARLLEYCVAHALWANNRTTTDGSQLQTWIPARDAALWKKKRSSNNNNNNNVDLI